MMKQHISIFMLIAGASLVIAAAEDPSPTPYETPSPTPYMTPEPSASPGPSVGPTRCPESSASVEVHTFYGRVKTVADKVAELRVNLSERRVFIQITQSGRTVSSKTSVKLFEQKDGKFMITEWSGANISGLAQEIDDTIIRDKGKTCVGAAIKAVLNKKLRPTKPSESSLPATASPGEAFAPSVSTAEGDFIKTEVIFGC